ncbi:hypothetical protein, partial [Salmonella sp. s55004]|uniref:hypothetical protein n=1 Tax=Salmonella sp. s55004 TaxID=3159675 RepID=UPI00397FC29E
ECQDPKVSEDLMDPVVVPVSWDPQAQRAKPVNPDPRDHVVFKDSKDPKEKEEILDQLVHPDLKDLWANQVFKAQ